MKKKILNLIFILVILIVVALMLQLIPMPDWFYNTAFIVLVAVAAFIYQVKEAAFGREAQRDANEESSEAKETTTYSDAIMINHKNIVYYNGHVIHANDVYMLVGYDADKDNVSTPVYKRIDDVYID